MSTTITVKDAEGTDAEDAARYRWLRDQCSFERRITIMEYADKGYLLDHHIDKGMCGL